MKSGVTFWFTGLPGSGKSTLAKNIGILSGNDTYPFEWLDGNKLRGLDNVVLTSHLGASTKEAEKKTSGEMAEVIIGFLSRGDYTNAVNVRESIQAEEKPVYPLFIHHEDVPGVFAEIGEVLRKHKINIRENPSRQIEDVYTALTVYLVHKPVGP